MLIKRTSDLTLKAIAVLAFVGTLASASTASADSSLLVERVITAKIQTSELTTKDGMAAVYARLETKALRACRADRATLQFTHQSMAECASDLMDQFIESAKIESLETYHLTQATTQTKKLASNGL